MKSFLKSWQFLSCWRKYLLIREIWRLITAFMTSCYWNLFWSQLNPPSYMFQVNFNIIMLYVSRYSNWFFSSGFLVCSCHLPTHITCCANFILRLVQRMIRVQTSTLFIMYFLASPVTSSPLCQNNWRALLSESQNPYSSLSIEVRTQIHIKHRVKL